MGLERLNLVCRNAEEVITVEELREILDARKRPKAYWGIEPSGLMHIGQGLICVRKIKDFVEAGFEFTVLLADWHAWINNKLGGNLDNIKLCGEYIKQVFRGLGLTEDKLSFRYASELVAEEGYWEKVVRIAKAATARRVWRALPIMGRAMDAEDVEAASLLYPCMQAADIFQLDVDVAYAGMDQRKAHMLAREVAEKLGWKKPSCVHTPLLMGLVRHPEVKASTRFDEDPKLSMRIELKMSKSIPESYILVHDQPEVIADKVLGAYCPPREEFPNPILELAKYTVFPEMGAMEVDRPAKHGGPKTYGSYEELVADYKGGLLHPLDLKKAVAGALAEMLKGVRSEFERDPSLLEAMKKLEVTR